jgi:radical SAM protein with 4Fe4S-binding SPASM domain
VTVACTSSITGYGALAARLRAKAARERIPVEGSLELTARCNLACRHCYVNQPEIVDAARPEELTTGQWRDLLDRIADAGCLWLGITGGEPLLRPDFDAIYRHARRRGFLVTLLTNGTLIDDRIAGLLAELPPLVVEVSLYGHTAPTYERVTGVPGSHAACHRGIEALASRGLPYRLKATVTRENVHELEDLRAFAADRGIEFRFDGLLNRRLDGGPLPAELALPAAELARLELADRRGRQGWEDRVAQQRAAPPSPHVCAAGVSAFHVDWAGRLMPCLMARSPAVPLLEQSFRDGWDGPLREVVDGWAAADTICRGCALAACCDACPGWSQLEGGDATRPVERLCRVAEERARALGIAGDSGRNVA